eukprot:Filipodium_phascolosomae@DN1957_c0_g1_i1.p1
MGHVVRKNNRAAGIFGQTIPAIPAPVPIKKEIQNAVKEASEFEVDIHPPDEDTQDILDGLGLLPFFSFRQSGRFTSEIIGEREACFKETSLEASYPRVLKLYVQCFRYLFFFCFCEQPVQNPADTISMVASDTCFLDQVEECLEELRRVLVFHVSKK